MKTNKILAIGLLAAATVLTTGCSDSFLEVENPTGEPLEDYYTTDEHIQEALMPPMTLSIGQIGDWDSTMP